VTDGHDGIVTRAGDANAMSQALETLLENPQLRKQMGVQGRARAQSMTWSEAAKVQWQFYLDVWGRTSSEPDNKRAYQGKRGSSMNKHVDEAVVRSHLEYAS
jgi:hypothetical protein